MSVRFVIGRAGTGKSHRCFTRLVDAMRADPLGPPLFWLLPKQATFEAERQLTCESGLPAFSRTHVVSFERMGQLILGECGGAAVPEISAYGRQMILGLLLRKHESELTFFKSVARQPGLAARLDSTFAELERSGKGLTELTALVKDLETDAESDSSDLQSNALLAKMRDFHRIYDAYCTYLGQERLDPHRRLQQVLASVSNCSMLKRADIYVDGFLDFSDYERKFLAGLAKVCHDMEITILADPTSPTVKDPHAIPDDLSLFHRTEQAYRNLHFALTSENIVIGAPVLLTKEHRLAWPPGDTSVAPTLIEAPNLRAEVDAAAAQIRSLLHQGHRLRDIAVLTRDTDTNSDLIDASFREHSIPFFLDRRRTVGHHPLLQFMRSAFSIAATGWTHEAVMTFAKSQLASLTLDEADCLENYVLQHRIHGDAWQQKDPWSLKRTRRLHTRDDAEDAGSLSPCTDADIADALRHRLADPLLPFLKKLASASLTVREIAAALFELFTDFKVRKTLAKWMDDALEANQLETRAEHSQVWTELVNLFDQMVELLGTEQVTLSEFLDILDSGLETFDLGLTPATVDQVLVGQVDRTRTSRAKTVLILGLNESSFPRSAREDSILSDPERRSLRDRNVDVEADSQRRLLDENLLGYLAFTRPSERLILLRSTADNANKATVPSIFWRDLRATFPNLKPLQFNTDASDPSTITTPRQLVTRLMKWVRTTSDKPQTTNDPFPSLYNWLSTHPCCSDAIDTVRYRSWRALGYGNTATLSKDLATKLFPQPLTTSISQLETFAACPYKHFLSYGLGLEVREDPDPTAMDLGNVYHETLEKLVAVILQQKLDFKSLPDAVAQQLIQTCTRAVGESLRGELMLSTARNRHILAHIEKTLEKVAASQKAMAQRGHFVPAFTELTFGIDRQGATSLPALVILTPAGRELRLRGKIDRVDLLEKQSAFAVIDYKLSDRKISLEQVYHGLSLQLLAYLLVIQAHGEQLAGKPLTPAAAFYVKLLRQLESVEHPDDCLDPESQQFHLRTKPRGIVDKAFVPRFDSALQPGTQSDVLAARLNKDGNYSATGDVAAQHELYALLGHVEEKLAHLADQLLDGVVSIAPYRLRTSTPCPTCEYKSVCRFQVGLNRYTHVQTLSRDQVLAQLSGGTNDAP